MTDKSSKDGDGREQAFDTRAVRSGQVRSPELEHNDAMFLTSSYVFEDARQAAARFADEEPGNVYSRFTNPTVRTFEERLAALEGARHCIGTSSGMSAILLTCLALLKKGDHVVAAHDLFGSTVSLFSNIMSRFGVSTSFVSVTDHQAWTSEIRPETRLLFIESPTNPLGEVANIPWLARLAHDHDCLLVVDNCLCTPALQLPFDRCVGGAVLMNDQKIRDDVFSALRTSGPNMSPFNAWVFLNGLETLSLRMKAHCEKALELARRLEGHPAVAKVYYPGLESHPQHRLAAKQQKGFGGIVAFEVHGDRREAWSVIDATRMLSITANLGDAKTTITHPASTTHSRITQEQRDLAGIKESLVRIAVGLEDVDDIEADLVRGLDALARTHQVRAANS
jgi:O-succinylhomoserine sulfhydrylase